MIAYHLSFDIDPRGKGRPCFTRNGHAYTPETTREYENALAVLAREQFTMDPFTGALTVAITFYMPTKDKTRWTDPHTMRPDLDNLCKAVVDALNGIVWKDDAIISRMVVKKLWARTGSVEVTVQEPEPARLVSQKVLAASDLVFKKLDAKIAKDPKLKAIYEKAKREAQDACAANETVSGEEYLRRAT